VATQLPAKGGAVVLRLLITQDLPFSQKLKPQKNFAFLYISILYFLQKSSPSA